MTTTNLDYTELERLAYISGKPGLAALYAKAAELDSIDIGAIKEAEYNRGYEDGKQAASDAELRAQVKRLTTDVEQKDENFAELLQAFDHFLKWLGTDDAKKATNRKQGVETLVSWLRRWR